MGIQEKGMKMRRTEGGERTRYQRNALPTACRPDQSIARSVLIDIGLLLLFLAAVFATGWDVVV